MKRPRPRENNLDDAAAWMEDDDNPVIEYAYEMGRYADHLETQLAESKKARDESQGQLDNIACFLVDEFPDEPRDAEKIATTTIRVLRAGLAISNSLADLLQKCVDSMDEIEQRWDALTQRAIDIRAEAREFLKSGGGNAPDSHAFRPK